MEVLLFRQVWALLLQPKVTVSLSLRWRLHLIAKLCSTCSTSTANEWKKIFWEKLFGQHRVHSYLSPCQVQLRTHFFLFSDSRYWFLYVKTFPSNEKSWKIWMSWHDRFPENESGRCMWSKPIAPLLLMLKYILSRKTTRRNPALQSVLRCSPFSQAKNFSLFFLSTALIRNFFFIQTALIISEQVRTVSNYPLLPT